jgi:TPR repeat protein
MIRKVKKAHLTVAEGRRAFENGNYVDAANTLVPLARKGDESAQYYVALMCHQGKGLPENKAAAMGWARKAAGQGNAPAEALIGLMYAQGHGVLRDDAEAVRWFQRAAEHGNGPGQMKLGMCYMCGQGLPVDYVKAYMWFHLAVSHSTGHDQASSRDLRDTHATMHLTPAQIEEARRSAHEWKQQKARPNFFRA